MKQVYGFGNPLADSFYFDRERGVGSADRAGARGNEPESGASKRYADASRRAGLSHSLQPGERRHLADSELSALLQALGMQEPAARMAGGGASNTLRVMAQLGWEASLFGSVGDDETAEWYRQELRHAGITPRLTTVPGGRTGKCVTLLPARIPGAGTTSEGKAHGTAPVAGSPGESTSGPPSGPTVLVSPESARRFDLDDIRSALRASADSMESDADDPAAEQSFPASVDLVYIEGFLFDRPALVDYIAGRSGSAGTPLAVDLGAPPVVRAARGLLRESVLPRARFVFGTAEEFDALGAAPSAPGPVSEPGERNSGLHERNAGPAGPVSGSLRDEAASPATRSTGLDLRSDVVVVVKKGDEGVTVVSGDQQLDVGAPPVGGSVPGPASSRETHARTDTPSGQQEPGYEDTGAGDVFAGVFLAGYYARLPLRRCAELAALAAASSLSCFGGQVPGETLERLAEARMIW